MYNYKIIKSQNIYNINIQYYLDNNIKYILCDLDNTLESFDVKEPSKKTIELVNKLTENNINLIICSNNNKKRVSKYAEMLSVGYIYRCFKPFKFKINNFIKKKNINKNECILIGDQFNTDIKCAKRLNVKCLFTEELVNKNAFISSFNKRFEKISIKKDLKKGLIKNMEEKYVIK